MFQIFSALGPASRNLRSSHRRSIFPSEENRRLVTPLALLLRSCFARAPKDPWPLASSTRCEERKFLLAEAGFTLIEVAIAIVLVSVLLGAIYLVYDAGFRTTYQQWTRTGAKGETGRAMITIGNDLRQATSVTAATATSMTFTLDSDGNGLDETVQLTWGGAAGNPLNRVQSAPAPAFTQLLVNSVNNLSFTYFDVNNNQLSFPVTASQVRLVMMDVTVLDNNETFELRSKFRLRNL